MLDAGLIFYCCEVIFKENAGIEPKDFLLFPIISLFCMAARAGITVGGPSVVLFSAQGYEVAPTNNVILLLILILSILLVNSIYYKSEDSAWTFCGTMTAFSLYLLARTVSVSVFYLWDAAGNLLLFGSRFLSIILIFFLSFTSAFERLKQTIAHSSFITGLVSANIAAILIAVLSVLSFDITRFINHLWLIGAILFVTLLLDSVLLYYNQRRIQEQKHIQMIEQYVPIVEELISQVRARQHEFNNRIFSIEAAVNSAATLEEARKHVAVLTKGVSLCPNDRDLLVCDSKIIAGMLYGKIKQAEFSGINVSLEFLSLFKKSATPETEWIEIIGILLDNALEAAAHGDTIYLKTRQEGSFLELTVSNPAPPMSNTEFMKLFQKGVTTKKDKCLHGFGLYNVLRMAERHHGKILTRNESLDQTNYVVFGILLP